MPAPFHHYHLRDLHAHLYKIGREDLSNYLTSLTKAIADAKQRRNEAAQQIFNEHAEEIFPHMRPCQQRNFKKDGHLTVRPPDFS